MDIDQILKEILETHFYNHSDKRIQQALRKIKALVVENLPEKKGHRIWCLTGDVGDNPIVCTKETACIYGKFYRDKVIAEMKEKFK